MKTRLGLDIGTNSIGWALLKIDQENNPIDIIDMGVRLFSDGRNPKTEVSLAVERRTKRQMRRRWDRFLERKQRLQKHLIKLELWPHDEAQAEAMKAMDVFALRVAALDRKLSPYELGRVFWHINQKRGFLSGRKESSEDKANKVKDRMNKLESDIKTYKCRTYGEYLNKKIRNGKSAKATEATGIYPSRGLIIHELDMIIESQQKYFKGISASDWENIKKIILMQRPLKEVELGPCSLYPEKQRSYRFLPSFEYYRFLSNLFNLSWVDENYENHQLNFDQVMKVVSEFYSTSKLKSSKIKKCLSLPATLEFKGESEKELEIPGPIVSNKFRKAIGEEWDQWSWEHKDQFVTALFLENDDQKYQEVVKLLQSMVPFSKLSSEQWKAIDEISPASDTTVAFSSEALIKIIQEVGDTRQHPMKVLYNLRQGEGQQAVVSPQLEYYGKVLVGSVVANRHVLKDILGNAKSPAPKVNNDELKYGKIANPTVHVVLRQTEKLVNDLIQRYGRPTQVHLEMVRDLKMSNDQKINIRIQQNKNKKINDDARSVIKSQGLLDGPMYMERYRLWNELKGTKVCIYSGKTISQEILFSDELEVDHILPFSRTLDDGIANKVLVFRQENREKSNKTPFEAWGADSQKFAEIIQRAKSHLPANKFYKFMPNAIQRFEADGGFIARQLTDTAYSAKIAKKYLGTIVENPDANVLAIPGKLTSLIRGKLKLHRVQGADLQGKDRDKNHLHHAVDALVVAITDRSYLKKAADLSKGKNQHGQLKIHVEEPWKGFVEKAQKIAESIVVSHKIDHGIQGRFLEETGYGIVSITKEPDRIAANEFLRKTETAEGSKVTVYEKIAKESLDDIGTIKSQVRVVKHGKNKQHAKFYRKAEVHHLAIWNLKEAAYLAYCTRNGIKAKKAGGDKIVAVCPYTADMHTYGHQYDKVFKPHPAASLKFKLHKGDLVSIEIDGKRVYQLVKSISPANGNVSLEHPNGGVESRKFSFNVLMEHKPKLHHISPSGKIL